MYKIATTPGRAMDNTVDRAAEVGASAVTAAVAPVAPALATVVSQPQSQEIHPLHWIAPPPDGFR